MAEITNFQKPQIDVATKISLFEKLDIFCNDENDNVIARDSKIKSR